MKFKPKFFLKKPSSFKFWNFKVKLSSVSAVVLIKILNYLLNNRLLSVDRHLVWLYNSKLDFNRVQKVSKKNCFILNKTNPKHLPLFNKPQLNSENFYFRFIKQWSFFKSLRTYLDLEKRIKILNRFKILSIIRHKKLKRVARFNRLKKSRKFFPFFFLPIKTKKITLLKSPHVTKKAKEHFQKKTFFLLINFFKLELSKFFQFFYLFFSNISAVKTTVFCYQRHAIL